jgi:GNAT superfamily N-acetyltransferase
MITVKEFVGADGELTAAIEKLERICLKHDGHGSGMKISDTAMNADAKMKNLFVLYEGDTLASAMTVFAPTKNEAEIYALTLPSMRRRGYFNLLYFRAVDEIKRAGISRILFACDRRSDTGFEAVSAHDAVLNHSECELRFTAEDRGFIGEYISGCAQKLSLEICVPEDAKKLAPACAKIFGKKRAEAEKYLRRGIADKRRRQYSALLGNETAGLGAVESGADGACIYGLGVMPELRGKGFGRQLLYLLVTEALKDSPAQLRIEADCSNEAACGLYLSSGFEQETIWDYYSRNI